jgi:hypothetical protein
MPSLLDLNQYRRFGIGSRIGGITSPRGVLTMSEIIKSEAISRRSALSLFGKIALFASAASTTALTVSDAEAQTVGMERRQERREGRHERREARREGRHERREARREGRYARREARHTGTTTGSTTTTGQAK